MKRREKREYEKKERKDGNNTDGRNLKEESERFSKLVCEARNRTCWKKDEKKASVREQRRHEGNVKEIEMDRVSSKMREGVKRGRQRKEERERRRERERR